MNEQLVILPEPEEMLERLVSTDDSQYMRDRFYPHLIRHAGEEKAAEGVLIMLLLAVEELYSRADFF